MGTKIEVTKEQYDRVRLRESENGVKATDAEAMFITPYCLNGVWGLCQIMRCYKSFTKYYAELRMVVVASSESDAENKFIEYMK